MLIGGIALGLILGLIAGGHITNLAYVRLHRLGLLFAAVFLRFGTETLLNAGFPPAELLRLPLLGGSFVLLLLALWPNRNYPGISLAFIGILANAVVIVVNGGYMPIWEPALKLAGLDATDVGALHVVLPPTLDADFLLRLGPFGDVIPIPLPIIQNVASIGDAFLSLGLAFFLFAAVVRVPSALAEEVRAATRARLAAAEPRWPPRPGDEGYETGLWPAFTSSIALERPLVMGSADAEMASPSLRSFELGTAASADTVTTPIPIPRPSPETVERVRQHPYVRLALNSSFSALWAGQLISLFGDRFNQLALVAVVLTSTGSAFLTGLVFFAATLPNLLLSPIAGTFVDRWDHKEVMVVSDILRAAIVLVLPVAAVTNIVLIYPLIFLTTCISVFFRPARVAILPQIVPERDLLSANSALWVGETIADVIGYPLAGILVALLGTAVPIAFWLDSATYLASAGLLATIVVQARSRSEEATEREGFLTEMKAGWNFLRRETVLLANTLQGAVGQFSLGIAIALTPSLVKLTYSDTAFGWQGAYGFLETGLGLGNLVGGFVIGLIGARFAKGRMVIGGYAAWGILTFLFAMVGNLPLAVGLIFGQGVANMVFIIPSQTLFQERTPSALMGRVVGFRFALVFGSMTIAMAIGSVLGEVFAPGPVIAAFGLVTAAAGLAGLLIPAVRDA